MDMNGKVGGLAESLCLSTFTKRRNNIVKATFAHDFETALDDFFKIKIKNKHRVAYDFVTSYCHHERNQTVWQENGSSISKLLKEMPIFFPYNWFYCHVGFSIAFWLISLY